MSGQPIAEYVNGIPSGDRLRRDLGMSRFARIRKSKNKRLSEILRRVKAVEHLRDFLSPHAITQLRFARKVMYPFVNELNGAYTNQKYYVQEALDAINARITQLAEHFYARGNDAKTPQLLGIEQRKAAFALENQVDQILWGGAAKPFRAIGDSYADERATRGHFRGAVVDNWRRANTLLSLERWGETVWNWRLDDGGGLFESRMNGAAGVRYLDETQRQGFKITIRAGQVRDAAGFFLHTGPMTTVGGEGQGWGIYVMDFFGNIYVGAHEKDRFHHSTFLAGAPVAAAGEIAVDNGRIIGVTNKTGHYKAGPTELVAMLRVLARFGVVLSSVAVRNRHASQNWFDGRYFVEADGDVAALANRTVPQPPRVAA